jgi:hypothetical protein
MLLGLVVARMRGAPDFISGLATFLNKLNITRVRSAVSTAAAPSDEARYHSRPLTTWPSVMVTGNRCALLVMEKQTWKMAAAGPDYQPRPRTSHACSPH